VNIAICPSCGYPTLGPDLCFYCRPVAMNVGSGDRAGVAEAEVTSWST
jgi:hypothetical protein